MSQAFLALEISREAVRGCRFSRERGGRILLQEMLLHRPDPEHGLEEVALTLLESLGAENAAVYLCLPAWDFMVRNMTLPFRGAGKISQVLPLEMASGLGLAADACEMAFIETGETEKGASGTKVLALALEKSRMERLVGHLGNAGYFVEAVTVSQVGAAISLASMEKIQEGWGLLDTRGSLVLMRGKTPLALRVLAPAEQGETSFVQAVFALLGELCTLRYPALDLKGLYVMGSGSAVLQNPLQEKLDFPIRVLGGDALAGLDPDHRLDADMEGACAVLSGWAALQGKAEPKFGERGWRFEHFWASHGKALVGSAFLGLIVLFLFGTHLIFDMQRLRARDRMLDHEIRSLFTATLPNVTRIVDPLHQMRVHLREMEQASAFAASGAAAHSMTDLLRGLAQSAPEGVSMTFTRLALTGDQLTLSGETGAYNNVDALKNRLAAQPFFSSVTITQATADQEEGRVRFNLRADLR